MFLSVYHLQRFTYYVPCTNLVSCKEHTSQIRIKMVKYLVEILIVCLSAAHIIANEKV